MQHDRFDDAKLATLRLHHALNPRPQGVTDPVFTAGHPFFDARDLVQVKYEMLRRVSQAAAGFGFSRPSYYAAEALFGQAGLPGLMPQRPGPRRAHKLSDEVVDFLEHALTEEPSRRATELARLVQEQFTRSVHPRSIERALERRRKKGHPQPTPTPTSQMSVP